MSRKLKQPKNGSNQSPGRECPAPPKNPPNQYGERNPRLLDDLGGYYWRHVAAMTRESLHSKSAIAAELAWRDSEIDRLKRERGITEAAANAAIQFSMRADDGIEFLRAWLHGELEVIRAEWPDCPEEALLVIAGFNS